MKIIRPSFNLQPSTSNLSEVEVAETFAERARGLIGRSALPRGKGMLIPKCNCIHTCFMRFAIDATFLDRRGNVVKVVRNIRPWRLWIWGGWKATQVLETAASCNPATLQPCHSATLPPCHPATLQPCA